jgi:hypothetical protein
MVTSGKLDWKLPTGIGLAVLALGSGVMGPLWALTNEAPGLPGWGDFTGTTVGDTVLLPILAASLMAAFSYLPSGKRKKETFVLACGALIGAVGGFMLQLSWVLDDKPRLSWILPRVHHFSALGYYHAVFLCVVSSILFSLAFGVTYRARQVSRDSPGMTPRLASSPLFFLMLVCIWAFSVLTIQGGGAGISNLATITSVIVPSLLAILLAVYALRPQWVAVLTTAFWALVLSSLLCLLIIMWPTNLDVPVGLIVALGLTSAIAFRDSGWPHRIAETCIIGAATACLIVLPLGDPEMLARNVGLCLIIAPVVVAITAQGPLVDKSLRARCSWTDAIIMCLFATSVPLVAFLLRNGVSDVGAGAFTVALAAPIVGERLVPWYQSQMERVTEGEISHSGVTVDPEMSALARLVAFRGVGLGIAALAVLLGIVISAGPSMGFVHGTGAPDLNPRLSLAVVLTALTSLAISVFARRSSLAPAAPIVGGLTVFGLIIANLADNHHYKWWWIWVAVAGALVSVWQVESIVANAAMRPRWLVRCEWRHAVAASVALAVGSLTLLACTDGMINPAGSPAEPLASLLVLIGAVLTGLMLIIAAGWSLDWQSSRAITSGEDQDEPNWAAYRMRACMLMDFGLIQGLITIGIWLPSLALIHIGLSSLNDLFNTAVMALTGMLLFIPIFIWALRNSVKHVDGQSIKAGRPPYTLFYETLPYVSIHEERQVARDIAWGDHGPDQQEEWASTLASHQLHLNLISLALAVVSLGGMLGMLIYITRNEPRSRTGRHYRPWEKAPSVSHISSAAMGQPDRSPAM